MIIPHRHTKRTQKPCFTSRTVSDITSSPPSPRLSLTVSLFSTTGLCPTIKSTGSWTRTCRGVSPRSRYAPIHSRTFNHGLSGTLRCSKTVSKRFAAPLCPVQRTPSKEVYLDIPLSPAASSRTPRASSSCPAWGSPAIEILRVDRASLSHIPDSLCTFSPRLQESVSISTEIPPTETNPET